MTVRPSRLRLLHEEVQRALEELDLGLDDRAHDGWLAPTSIPSAEAGDPLLLRVATELPEDAPKRWTPAPSEPWWLRHDEGAKVVLVPMRGGPRREVEATKVRLVTEPELCCDAPKCEVERPVGILLLDLDELPGTVVVGEQIGDEQVADLAAAGHALAERFGVSWDGPEGKATDGATALSARSLSRWSMRREAEHFVVRDHAQRGPAEAVSRNAVILGAMVIAFAGSWYGTWGAYEAKEWTQVAIFGATALVMTFFVVTMTQILRHSMAYRGRSEALAWLARDRVVPAPWHDREGAVDLGTAGQYGAAIPLGEIDRLNLVKEASGWSLRCDGDHGPFEVGVLEDEDQAKAWLAALARIADGVSHGPNRSRLGKGAAAAALVFAFVACVGPPPPVSPAPAPAASPVATTKPEAAPASTSSEAVAPAAAAELAMVEDDVPRAMAEAKAAGKKVFVEVWAPWCHTCLSMKNFVLPDPALAPLRDQVVFAAIDSDRPANAAFMERYEVQVWPTLFVLEPQSGEVLGLWPGAASVEELRRFIGDAIDDAAAARDPQGPLAAMREAKRAHGAGDWAVSASGYQLALDRGGAAWARRSEALLGLVFSEYRQRHWERCAQLGSEHAAGIEGAAVPADFAWVLLSCAEEVKAPALSRKAHEAAMARLKRHTDAPPASASVDDRSDALSMYAGALAKAGDAPGAKAARARQIALLDGAVAAAPGPKEAATFDYARMGAYLAVGRGPEAVAFLRERCGQLPDSYEPPARLAQALMSLGRHREALAPLEDAVGKSYGPRQLRYLDSLATAKAKLGDRIGQRDALQRLVKAYEALPTKQREQQRHRRLADAARKTLGG